MSITFWSSPCMSALYKSPKTEGFTHSVVKQHLELTWLGKIMAFSMHFALSLLLLALEIDLYAALLHKIVVIYQIDPIQDPYGKAIKYLEQHDILQLFQVIHCFCAFSCECFYYLGHFSSSACMEVIIYLISYKVIILFWFI